MMMEHAQIQELFSDYWERGLPEPARREVEEHLAGCAACRAEYAAFEKAMQPLGKLGKEHRVPAPELLESVPALIHKRSRGRFFGRRSQRLRLLEWASLGMLGVLAAVYLLLKLMHPLVRLQ